MPFPFWSYCLVCLPWHSLNGSKNSCNHLPAPQLHCPLPVILNLFPSVFPHKFVRLLQLYFASIFSSSFKDDNCGQALWDSEDDWCFCLTTFINVDAINGGCVCMWYQRVRTNCRSMAICTDAGEECRTVRITLFYPPLTSYPSYSSHQPSVTTLRIIV